MILLGFADDVLDLRWSIKIALSFSATLPILVAYSGATNVIVPKPFQLFLGVSIQLGKCNLSLLELTSFRIVLPYLYGSPYSILHQFNQHLGWHQWVRSWPILGNRIFSIYPQCNSTGVCGERTKSNNFAEHFSDSAIYWQFTRSMVL